MNTNHQTKKDKHHTKRQNESGYALIGLMGVMMFALILTTAAAPTLRREAQREREEEMLWRGQQVASAISRYFKMRGGQPLTDLNELVQGIDIGVKKIRLLRPSALCDPMTPCTDGTNWRLVHPGDPLPKELLEAILATMAKKQIPLNQQILNPNSPLMRFAQMGAVNLPGQAADTQLDGNIGPVNNSGQNSSQNSDSDSNEKKQPIIGVVSKKSDRMFRSYFGIEEYDHVLFFPDVPVLAGGFVNPLAINVVAEANPNPNSGAKDRNCPGGGVFIDTGDGGRCWGGLIPGQIKRDPNAQTSNETPKP